MDNAGSFNPHAVIVNARQKGNPVLNFVRNVPWQFGEIVPDFLLGRTTCCLFLSFRYHRLHPDYIHARIHQLGSHMYLLRVLLCLVDVEDHESTLAELSKVAVVNKLTMMLSWSNEEAGRYIETYKSYENKPADSIKARVNQDYFSQVTECLTSIRSVNKTDVVTLLSTFGSLHEIMHASAEEFALCPGIGEQKAKRIYEAFHQPFRTQATSRSNANANAKPLQEGNSEPPSTNLPTHDADDSE